MIRDGVCSSDNAPPRVFVSALATHAAEGWRGGLIRAKKPRSGSSVDASLPLDIGYERGVEPATLRLASHRRVGLARTPLARCTGGGLLHHLVDLLKGKTLRCWSAAIRTRDMALGTYLCLGNDEPRVHKRSRAKASPDKEDGGFQVGLVGTHHVGRDDGNDLGDISRMPWIEETRAIVQCSTASWKQWTEQHHGSGSEAGKPPQ